MNSIVENICHAINRTSNNFYIVTRYIMLTGLLNAEGQNKYLFLDELFCNIIPHEKSLVYFNIKDLYSNKSSVIEFLLYAYSIFLLLYTLFFGFLDFYKGYNQNHASIVFIINNESNNIENVSKKLEHLGNISTNIRFNKLNIYYYFDYLINATVANLYKYIEHNINDIYKSLNYEISNLIRLNLNFNISNEVKIDDIIEKIQNCYDNFADIMHFHNNIDSEKNVIKNLSQLNYLIAKSHGKEKDCIVLNEISDNHVILDYREIQVCDFNTYLFANKMINSMIEVADHSNVLHKIQLLNNLITNIFSSNDDITLVKQLLKFNNVFHDLNFNDIEDLISLKHYYKILDELKRLKYLTDSEFSRMQKFINKKSSHYKYKILNSENKLIGKLFILAEDKIIYSDKFNLFQRRLNSIIESNIYKHLILHLESSVSHENDLDYYYVIKNLDPFIELISEYNNFLSTLDNNYIDNTFALIFNRISNLESNYLWHDNKIIINNILHAREKYLNYIDSHIKQNYEKYKAILEQSANHVFSKLTKNIQDYMMQYFKSLYKKLYSCNILCENINFKGAEDNYLGFLFKANNKDHFIDIIDKNFKRISDILTLAADNILLFGEYVNKILDLKEMDYFICLTNAINDINEYEDDKINSMLGQIKSMMIKSYSNLNVVLIDINRNYVKEKSYFSQLYVKQIKNINEHAKRCRLLEISKDFNILRNLCLSKKDYFPFNLDGKKIATIEEINVIIDTGLDLIDKVIDFQESEENILYKNLINLLYGLQEISDIMEKEILLNLKIYLSENLQSASFIKARHTNSSGEEKEVDIEIEKNISLNLNLDSDIEIIFGPLLHNMIRYQEHKHNIIDISDNIIINYNSPSYFSIIHHSILNDNSSLGSLMESQFVIPIYITELSIDKAHYQNHDSHGQIKIKIMCNHKIISLIQKLDHMLHAIINFKLD